MGLLLDGKWVDRWYDTKKTGGSFERKASSFRNWVTADGSAGPGGKGGFKAEAGRYHLYVSYACPWAHRTLIFRALKGLEGLISVSVVDPLMAEEGWVFDTPEPIGGARRLYEVYLRADPTYSGRVTVPVLWDKKTDTIVSNESSEIIRMMNSAFNHLTGDEQDFCPEALCPEIDKLNDHIYGTVNNGVYRAGFATSQHAYEAAYDALFAALDGLEDKLSGQAWLTGDVQTEADWRLFTTLVRFDAVYYGHFKCNRQLLAQYPALSAYTRALYQTPGVAATVHMDHIKTHYYASHGTINPTGIVPKGPVLDFTSPHGREKLTGV